MALNDTILDIRNMQRAIKLRDIQDPKEVTALLEKVLRDAILAQASGSKSFERKAFKEMTQIRQDLVAGQINAGAAKESMVGVYSHLIDQMNAMQKDNHKTSKATDSAFKQLSNSIPSADTFVSALMTANPLVGYGVKIARDIIRATKTSANNQKAEKDKKLKVLAQQEKYVKEQLRLLDLEEEKKKKEKKEDKTEKKEKKKTTEPLEREIYAKLLEEIKDNTKKLLEEWTGTSTVGSPSVEAINDPTVEGLEQIDTDIKEQSKLTAELDKEEAERLEKVEMEKERNSKLERLKEGSEVPAPDMKPLNDKIKEESGGFGKMLEGIITPLMLILRGGLMAFAGAAAALFIDLVAIPAAIGLVIYKFLDGFFNAEKIIGKDAKDISWVDRIKAGLANIWGMVFKIVNWVIKLFGFEGFDTKNIEKKIYKVFDTAQTEIVEGFKTAVKYMKDKYQEVIDSVTGIYDKLLETFNTVSKFVTDKFDSLTKWFTDLKDKGLIETFRDMISQDDPRPDYNHRQNDNSWLGDVPLPDSPQTYRGDVPIPGTPQRNLTPAPIPKTPQPNLAPNPDTTPRLAPVPKVEQDPSNKIDQVPKIERAPAPEINRPGIDTLPPPNPNPNILRMKSEPTNGQGVGATMRSAEANVKSGNQQASAPIIAPTNNNQNINNHNYNGPPTTSNLDPDFRTMMFG